MIILSIKKFTKFKKHNKKRNVAKIEIKGNKFQEKESRVHVKPYENLRMIEHILK